MALGQGVRVSLIEDKPERNRQSMGGLLGHDSQKAFKCCQWKYLILGG